MLYYVFRFLEQWDVPGSGMWSFISFRSLLALILALVISAWFGEYFIRWMKRHHISETQRDASIDPFGVQKINVPSMGGIIIIVSILVPCLLLGRNMAWLLKCIELGKANGITHPENPRRPMTNFIR